MVLFDQSIRHNFLFVFLLITIVVIRRRIIIFVASPPQSLVGFYSILKCKKEKMRTKENYNFQYRKKISHVRRKAYLSFFVGVLHSFFLWIGSAHRSCYRICVHSFLYFTFTKSILILFHTSTHPQNASAYTDWHMHKASTFQKNKCESLSSFIFSKKKKNSAFSTKQKWKSGKKSNRSTISSYKAFVHTLNTECWTLCVYTMWHTLPPCTRIYIKMHLHIFHTWDGKNVLFSFLFFDFFFHLNKCILHICLC